MENLTLNQLIKIIKTFADNHEQIEEFRYGDISNISQSETQSYPLLWMDLINAGVENNIFNMNISFKVLDIQKDDISNNIDTQNDTLLIIQDLYTYLNWLSSELGSFEINNNASIDKIKEAYNDVLNGFEIILTFYTTNNLNYCDIPIL